MIKKTKKFIASWIIEALTSIPWSSRTSRLVDALIIWGNL